MSLRSFFKGAILVTASAALIAFITLAGILAFTSTTPMADEAGMSQYARPLMPSHGTGQTTLSLGRRCWRTAAGLCFWTKVGG